MEVESVVAFNWPRRVECVRLLRYDARTRNLPAQRQGRRYQVRVEGIREHAVLVLPGG